MYSLLDHSGSADSLRHYQQLHRQYERRGCRVLILAHRKLWSSVDPKSSAFPTVAQWKDHLATVERSQIERHLQLIGCVVLECAMKALSAPTIVLLRQASIRCVMITGDALSTAVATAQKCSILLPSLPVAYLAAGNDNDFYWSRELDDTKIALDGAFDSAESIRSLCSQYELAIDGDVLSQLAQLAPQSLNEVCLRCKVFARMTPAQKQLIVERLQLHGHSMPQLKTKPGQTTTVLHIGDGVNDVSALKQADVGVALLSMATVQARKSQLESKPLNEIDASVSPMQAMEQMMSSAGGEEDTATVTRFGDASVAAPFSLRADNVSPLLTLLRQGRLTLVTTQQMFRILGVSSLLSAFSFSSLTMQGVKYGDGQMTVQGMLNAFSFLMLSRASPNPRLSAQHPPSRMFTAVTLLNIVIQSAIHLACLVAAVRVADRFTVQFVTTFFLLNSHLFL